MLWKRITDFLLFLAQAFLKPLFEALFGWAQNQAEKPETATYETTPKPVVDAVNADLRERLHKIDLRHQDSAAAGQKRGPGSDRP